jgi:hypothetical protein
LKAPARARSGAPVPLFFTVANTGKSTITLHLMGRVPAADFRVWDAAERLVWSRLRGQTMMGALRLYPLEPGKRLSFQHSWNQHADTGRLVPTGEYTVRGVLLTDDPKGLESPAASLRVES